LAEHTRRHHKVPSKINIVSYDAPGTGAHTEKILDGMEKAQAIGALVESSIVWRAQYLAWNVDIYKAETLLFRLIFKEGSQNPQAVDLLARIYFQQGKYEKARELWNKALALQPGNPALRRTAAEMRNIAKSPVTAVRRHKISMFLNCLLTVLVVCIAGLLCMRVYEEVPLWVKGGSPATENLGGRFSSHYKYNSITEFMEYVPAPPTTASAESDGDIGPDPDVSDVTNVNDGRYTIGFTRKKVNDGKEIGRIEVVAERSGGTLKVSGKIPNLYVRYLVEEALWEIPGVTDLDMRGLTIIDRTYQVNKGDNLRTISRRLYGEGSSWILLAKANDLSDPDKLQIGQELVLPLGDEFLSEDDF
jgi:LysM repeat protein